MNFKKHGKGKLIFGDGKIYEGNFEDGVMSGQGIMTNGVKIYEGAFKNGKQHGIGVYFPKGKTKKGKRGRWRNGKRIEWLN